jgi:hypothetical protein
MIVFLEEKDHVAQLAERLSRAFSPDDAGCFVSAGKAAEKRPRQRLLAGPWYYGLNQ